MASFHDATFELLGIRSRAAAGSLAELEGAERRLGVRLPPSVREWYENEGAMPLLAEHSNDDPPIPIGEFTVVESPFGRLLPIRRENQGVCTWAVLLDGSDDPPVFVDVDSGGREWRPLARSFSLHVYTCVWDYRCVLHRSALVQAQNEPISPRALDALATSFEERPSTSGWPGSVQHRYAGREQGILIWSTERQSADWFVGAADAASLESALRVVWDLDRVGASFYGCTEVGEEVLARVRGDA